MDIIASIHFGAFDRVTRAKTGGLNFDPSAVLERSLARSRALRTDGAPSLETLHGP